MLDFLRRRTTESDTATEHRSSAAKPVPNVPTLTPELPGEPSATDISLAAAPVHLVASKTRLRMENSTLVIEKKCGEEVRRPIEHVSAIHIYGGGLISSAVVSELSAMGRSIIWRSHSGYPVSWNAPMAPAGLAARRNQYRISENQPERLAFSKNIISTKITNMRGFLRRRKVLEDDIARRMEKQAKSAFHCRNEKSLLGIEGTATRTYFSSFPALLKHKGAVEKFAGRSRRPPSNLANSTMSYLYAVLLGECVCAIAAAGLDPRCGIFHRERAGRPALALDLMEPFRAPIVDACVTTAINTGAILSKHARKEGAGQLLSDNGKRKALAAIEKRYAEQITRLEQKGAKSWRDQIHHDALLLADILRNGGSFTPMRYP